MQNMLKLFSVQNYLERRMKRVLVIIPVLAILILSISFLIGSQIINAQAKVSKEEILKTLSSTDFSKAKMVYCMPWQMMAFISLWKIQSLKSHCWMMAEKISGRILTELPNGKIFSLSSPGIIFRKKN